MKTFRIQLNYRLHFQGAFTRESHAVEVQAMTPELAQVVVTEKLIGLLGGVDQISTEVLSAP